MQITAQHAVFGTERSDICRSEEVGMPILDLKVDFPVREKRRISLSVPPLPTRPTVSSKVKLSRRSEALSSLRSLCMVPSRVIGGRK